MVGAVDYQLLYYLYQVHQGSDAEEVDARRGCGKYSGLFAPHKRPGHPVLDAKIAPHLILKCVRSIVLLTTVLSTTDT
jgi:hypothetical protein